MKNQILRSTAILGLFFMLVMASVNAQTPSRVEVKIPFDFSAGTATLKAGTYRIKTLSDRALSIRSVDGKTTAIVSAPLLIESRNYRGGERVVFNQYGNQYFLSQVWLTFDTGRQLFTSGAETKTAHEYKLANNNAKPQRVEIAIRK
jgi:hypothetical protein